MFKKTGKVTTLGVITPNEKESEGNKKQTAVSEDSEHKKQETKTK